MKHHVRLTKTLPIPYPEVCHVLQERSARTLRSAGRQLVTHQHRYTTKLEVPVSSGTHLRRAVAVDIGVYDESHYEARLPVQITAIEHPGLFPTLQATLTAREVEGGSTEVALDGDFRDPLGPLGAVGAAVGGRHKAEASLQAFFDDLIKRIGLEAREARPAWCPPLVPTSLLDWASESPMATHDQQLQETLERR